MQALMANSPKVLYCRSCRKQRATVGLKGIGVSFNQGYHATYYLDCGHTAETPYMTV